MGNHWLENLGPTVALAHNGQSLGDRRSKLCVKECFFERVNKRLGIGGGNRNAESVFFDKSAKWSPSVTTMGKEAQR